MGASVAMATAGVLGYKKNYRVSAAVELFYTGGPVVVSPDASFVACACKDEVKVVDLESGKLRATLEGDSELVTALALSPDGERVYSASRSLQIRVWDVGSASSVRSWKAHESPVVNMAVDASGVLLATASADRSVQVWNVDRGYCTHAFHGHKGVVTSVLFHTENGRLLLFSGSDDGTIRIWDLMRKICKAVLDKHFSSIASLAISSNGQMLLSAGKDKVVNVWDLRSYSLQTTIPVYEAVGAVCILPVDAFFPGCSMSKDRGSLENSRIIDQPLIFLTAGELGLIRCWDANSSTCVYEQSASHGALGTEEDRSKGGFNFAFLLPECQGLICVTADHRFLFYKSVDGESGKNVLKLSKRLIGYNEEIVDLKFVGDGGSYLAVATNLERIQLYDMESMTCLHELVGHTDIVLCLDSCISALGQSLLASSAKDHTVRVWNGVTGICLAVAAGHTAPVGAICFSKKRKDFFVSGSSDRTLKLWCLKGIVHSMPGSSAPTQLVSQAVVVAHDKDINSVAVAPNDSLVCTASQDRTARVWKLPELTPVVTLLGHKRGVWCVEFSPVDQCVMTSSGDKTIRIWAISDGSCLKTFEGHMGSVLKASFITRGTQIISTGGDGLVKLWTIKSNECINTYENHADKIWALAVSEKEDKLATGGADSLINIWTDSTAVDEEEASRKEEEDLLKDQQLTNSLKEKDYMTAIQLAFELQRPAKLLQILSELLRRDDNEALLPKVLLTLDSENLRLLLSYARDWNSKSKFCLVAQRVIFYVLKSIPAKQILKVHGIQELLQGIVPYTERHSSRVDRVFRSTFLLDYVLSSMAALVSEEDIVANTDKLGVISLDKIVKIGHGSLKRNRNVQPFRPVGLEITRHKKNK